MRPSEDPGQTQGFWWGTAASSTQAEGAAPTSDWWQWERVGRVPASGDGNGFASRYDADFRLLADLELRHHRLSIEWARIEPECGIRDPEAIAHNARVLAAARDAGIHVWICLHHFTLPVWFTELGGFETAEGRECWRRHVTWIADAYGDEVYGWKPVNEPVAYAAAGWLLGVHPPGETDVAGFLACLEATYVAATDAARVLHGTGRPVATVEAASPLFPARDTQADRAATQLVDDVCWGTWTRLVRDGVLHVPGREPIDIPDAPEVFDLAGFSYYSAATVGADLSFGPYPPQVEPGPMGYVAWSGGLDLVLRRIETELPGRPVLVCEHGVGTRDDTRRCVILAESLELLGRAMGDGVDVRGFFHWTGVDNYEWAFGFDVPFGLIDAARVPKASAGLLHEWAGSGHPRVPRSGGP
ncbi:MAG: family 1 glycosylhydrolase [Acidimicrobiia bacterium]|nr:family 1 glycosylhydrolase [Acidimicrobiia bacterium]